MFALATSQESSRFILKLSSIYKMRNNGYKQLDNERNSDFPFPVLHIII